MWGEVYLYLGTAMHPINCNCTLVPKYSYVLQSSILKLTTETVLPGKVHIFIIVLHTKLKKWVYFYLSQTRVCINPNAKHANVNMEAK